MILIRELFDTVPKLYFDSSDPEVFYADAVINGKDYLFQANYWDDQRTWEVTFQLGDGDDGQTDVTSTGDVGVVMTHVYAFVMRFLEDIRPKSFMYTAKEPSRVKLYARFANYVKKEFGYAFETEKDSDGDTVFRFAR